MKQKAPHDPNHFKKIEEHHFKKAQAKYIPKKRPECPTNNCEKLSSKWQNLTPKQKTIAIIAGLIGAGLSAIAIYHMLPLIAHLVAGSGQNTTQNDLIKKISVQPKFKNELKERGLGSLVAKFEHQATRIDRALPKTINQELLTKVLKEDSFSIEIVPQNDATLTGNGQASPDARYLPLSNKVLIAADTDMTEAEAIKILRNELYHALVRYTNYQQSSNKEILLKRNEAFAAIRPFIKHQWKTDPVLFKMHAEAIEKGFSRVTAFQELLLKNPSSSSFFQNENRKLYMTAVAFYQPVIHREEVDPSMEIEKQLQRLPSGKQYLKVGNFPPIYIQNIIRYDNTLIIKFSYAKSDQAEDKAKALFQDLQQVKESITTRYYDNTAEDKDLELSSSIQELEPELLKVFFPEWCEYYSAYHQVEEYCRL